MRTALLALALVACSPSPEPYEWPERDATVVRLEVGDEFTADEADAVEDAVAMWNAALGDAVVGIEPGGLHRVVERCEGYAGRVWWPDIWLCREQLEREFYPAGVDLTTVVAHELGHILLGSAEHLDSGLMHWEAEHRSWAEVDDAARAAACEVWCG